MNRHLPLPEQPKPEEKKPEEVKTEPKGKHRHRNIVEENIIYAPKMRNNFWYPIKMVIFQYFFIFCIVF